MSKIDEFIKAFLSPDPSNMEFDEWERMVKDAAAEVEQMRTDLAEANDNLVSMVGQYCLNTVKKTGMPWTYSHSFMSAGEDAFAYLTRVGLAKWCENGVDIIDLQRPPAHPEEKSVKQ